MRPLKPWNDGEPVYRHVVTVHVDTYERSSEKVVAEVQACLDENTGSIGGLAGLEFEDAKAVGAHRFIPSERCENWAGGEQCPVEATRRVQATIDGSLCETSLCAPCFELLREELAKLGSVPTERRSGGVT